MNNALTEFVNNALTEFVNNARICIGTKIGLTRRFERCIGVDQSNLRGDMSALCQLAGNDNGGANDNGRTNPTMTTLVSNRQRQRRCQNRSRQWRCQNQQWRCKPIATTAVLATTTVANRQRQQRRYRQRQCQTTKTKALRPGAEPTLELVVRCVEVGQIEKCTEFLWQTPCKSR